MSKNVKKYIVGMLCIIILLLASIFVILTIKKEYDSELIVNDIQKNTVTEPSNNLLFLNEVRYAKKHYY